MGSGENPRRAFASLPGRLVAKATVVRRDARRRRLGAPCLAPYANLYLGPQGEVRACCVQSQYLGNVRVQRLPEIWNGVQQAELRRRLRAGDRSYGCNFCLWEHERDLTPYARYYDVLDVRSASPPFPSRMEFALTNACNLQCTMCTGELSSSIRIHREGRTAAPKAYGEEFFADLEAFVPHLRYANFVGGEPFLGAENYRVWDLLAEHGRGLAVDITTNGTQWSDRVDRVLRSLRPALQVSIDGATRATFESIRQGADFDEVRANVERFLAHARTVGTPVDISHCLMPQNHHEFGDLLLYAEERGMHVHVGVVSTPADHALERLDRADLAEVHDSLRRQAERVLPHLRGHNAAAMVEQVDRVRSWLEAADDARPAPTIEYERVLGIRRSSPTPAPRATADPGPPDPPDPPAPDPTATAGARLDRADRRLHVGPNDIILDCSPAAAEWLGVAPAALIGVHVERLEAAMAQRFGALAPVGEDGEDGEDGEGPRGAGPTGDVVERTFTVGAAEAADPALVRTVGVAVRDRAGWIERVVLAIGHPAEAGAP